MASGSIPNCNAAPPLHGRRLSAQPRPRRAPTRAFGKSLSVSATAPSRRAEDREARAGAQSRSRVVASVRAPSRVRFVQLAAGYRLDVDVGLVLAGLREVVGHLQPQP